MATDEPTRKTPDGSPAGGSHGHGDGGGWADRPRNRRNIRWAVYVACVILVVADFVVHRHISTPAESVPAFYAIYGFLALVGVVMAAKGLRRLVKRDEAYYDR